MSTLVLPLENGASGLVIYANPAALPPTAPTGTTVAVASDSTVRQWDGAAWAIVGDGTVVTTVNDTNSIDLTLASNILSADIRLSSNAADASNQKVDLDVQGTSSLGIRAQIPDSRIQGVFSATAPVVYSSGNISMAAATTSVNGYLTSTDWNTFNNKVSTTRTISTTSPITGGGDLSSDRTIAIPVATGSANGYLASADWTTFNSKQAAITIGSPGAGNTNGLVLSAGTLTAHLATGSFPGLVSTAAQTFAGDKTFAGNPIVTNNATNNSFVGLADASLSGATASNLQTATVTFGADSHTFVIEIGTERYNINCMSSYASSVVQFISDPGNLALITDAGTGLYIFKSASSNVVSIKNRLGGSRVIRVRVLNTIVSSATAWA